MKTNRLEGFSDGVLAIVITIMIVTMKIPQGNDWQDLRPILPTFISYSLSYIYLGIYWSNHHHLWHAVKQVNGKVLWCNLNLLFWLSLLPFSTSWMGQNSFSEIPVALYGFILLMASVAWYILILAIKQLHSQRYEEDTIIEETFKDNWKGKVSSGIYLATIGLSFLFPKIAFGIYMAVAVMWFIPNRKLEKKLME